MSSFGIRLDSQCHGKVYYAGDILTGVVHLTGPFRNDHSVVICVEFRGISHSSSALHPGTDYEKLCSSKKILGEGDYSLQNQEQRIWDFKFIIPQHALNQSKYPSSKSWDSPLHLLPPTWRAPNTTGSDFIRYELLAKVAYAASASSFWRGQVTEQRVPIYFRRSTPTINYPPQVIEKVVQITMPQPENGTRSSCTQFSLLSFFRRSLANINVREYATLRLHVPVDIRIGEPQTIFLEQSGGVERGFTNPMPQIRLLSIEHRVQSTIWVRIRDTPESNHKSIASDLVSGLVPHFTPVATRRFTANMMGRVLAEGEILDLGTEMGDLVLDKGLSRSFESFAMSLRYESKTTVRFEVGGKEQSVVFKYFGIRVM